MRHELKRRYRMRDILHTHIRLHVQPGLLHILLRRRPILFPPQQPSSLIRRTLSPRYPSIMSPPSPPPLLPQQRPPSLNNPIIHDPEIVLPRIPMLVHEMHTPLLRRRAHLVAALDETGVNFFAAVVAQDRGDGIVVLGYVQREKVR